jgi:hypothetical protein
VAATSEVAEEDDEEISETSICIFTIQDNKCGKTGNTWLAEIPKSMADCLDGEIPCFPSCHTRDERREERERRRQQSTLIDVRFLCLTVSENPSGKCMCSQFQMEYEFKECKSDREKSLR